jgi:transcriptional activator SPT7
MDLGTMLKKVKNKNYKSKREFKDDLELIWSNCYQYNAAEVPLTSSLSWSPSLIITLPSRITPSDNVPNASN